MNGIIPATLTPLDEQERFVPSAYEKLLEHIYAAGSHGIYVCGQTGEGLLQSVEQRKQVAEASLKLSPKGKQVIVHVGAYRTADAVELARHAAKIGVTAISSLPPFGSYSFDELRAYYVELAAATDLPLLVYYFPDAAPGIKTAEQILDLCSIKNVVGLKFTDFDLYRMRILKQSGAIIFNGRDEALTPGLLMGADGGIGTFYNIWPDKFVEIWDHTQHGDWTGALPAQDAVNTLIRITLANGGLPAVKQIMQWMGIDCGPCIRPRARLSAEQVRELRRQLEPCGIGA